MVLCIVVALKAGFVPVKKFAPWYNSGGGCWTHEHDMVGMWGCLKR